MAYETVGVSTSTSLGTNVTGGGANSKGSWTELDASTSVTCEGIWVHVGGNQTSNYQNLIDIGTGAASSEVVLIPDVMSSCGDTFGDARSYLIPISIASGTRLSARTQNNIGAAYIKVSCTLVSDAGLDITSFTNVDAMGVVSSGASEGTIVDPGATANTKGSYVEIDASTAQNYKGIIIAIGQNGNTALNTYNFLLDVAVGVAASEVNFIENLMFNTSALSDYGSGRVIGPIACDIPASSRLSVRSQSSGNDATDRVQDIIIYGLN